MEISGKCWGGVFIYSDAVCEGGGGGVYRIGRTMAQKVHCWGMGVPTRAMLVGWEGVVE